MIRFKAGDLLKENAEAIVNTVNCVGVMGRGIALQFKKAYPENFKAYEKACKQNKVKPGKMFIYPTNELFGVKYIINFPTKRHWKGKSKIIDIKTGLKDLVSVIRNYNIKSIAIPPLGSGLGGLNWLEVKNLIEKDLSPLSNVDIIIFEPKGAPNVDKMVRNRKKPNMTPGRASLIILMREYLKGLLDPFVTLLEIHKLMYFLQESGESLKLKYVKAPYGPYAKNLRHVLNEVEGYYILGYADGDDNPTKPIKLLPNAYEKADEFLIDKIKTRERFEKVTELVDGFESPYGLELLSSVHWVVKYEEGKTKKDVEEKIYRWNQKKFKFTTRQINIAVNRLCEKKIIEICT